MLQYLPQLNSVENWINLGWTQDGQVLRIDRRLGNQTPFLMIHIFAVSSKLNTESEMAEKTNDKRLKNKVEMGGPKLENSRSKSSLNENSTDSKNERPVRLGR